MRIKTFQGRSLEEVLPKIREELGPNAVVVGQRQKVQGGVAGFFGTKVIEVTAADQMPNDDLLVDLEDQLMNDDSGHEKSPSEQHLKERFAGAMRMGRVGGLDVTDNWDPAQDAELAQEYGRVLEHAAAAGFQELEVPQAPVVHSPLKTQSLTKLDPIDQAQVLAERARESMRDSAQRADYAMNRANEANGVYAPPQALPSTNQVNTQSFTASVDTDISERFNPQAITDTQDASTAVEHALRTDLALPRTGDTTLAGAISAAIDGIDLSEITALRGAVHSARRSASADIAAGRAQELVAHLDAEAQAVVDRLRASGVDEDVVQSVVDTAIRHRLPFGGEQNIANVVRSVVEEYLDVRSGFPSLDRTYRTAFVGPASAGRTSMIAKLANRYSRVGMNVGILSIVVARPGVPVIADRQFDGLNAVIRYASNPAQALDAMDTFTDLDVVFIDTPGSSYLDPETLKQVQACLIAIGVDDVHVVLPLSTSTLESRSVVDTFRTVGANRLVVSRIDESRHIGQILNFGFRLGLPMSYISDGPRIEQDVHAASARELAQLITKDN